MAPAEYLTIDKKNIVVESLATWRIADPRQFLETVATRAAGDERLADVIQGEIGSVLGRYPAGSLISTTGAASRFRSVVSEIQGRVTHFTQIAYGIEVVDVDIVHLSLPGQNKEHVFERMRAERGKIAKEHRSSGELEAKRIIAEAEREKTRIETEAYVEAERFKAEGDAKASAIYRSAFNRDPGFYKFLRTLQAYEKFVDESTTMLLPAEAEVFEVLRQQAGPGGVPAPWSSAAGPAKDANSASCADPVGSEPGRAGGQLLARNCPGRAP
jgi:membrane protease subunit HflC